MYSFGMNIAYIDAANVNSAVRSKEWKLDYRKFRVWLSDKFNIEKAYIFIGYIPEYATLYAYFRGAGFTLVFKEVVYNASKEAKGNCDAELIVQAMTDLYEGHLTEALLISSDGDFTTLVRLLDKKQHLIGILSPASARRCSVLLKRLNVRMWFLDEQRHRLQAHTK